MTSILGISAFYHDSAAALLVDGKIVAAAQEERFSRIKHDPAFPKLAIESCLQKAGLEIEDLDHVVFYEKPFLKFERILETYLHTAPKGWKSFLTSMPIWLGSKLYQSRLIQKGLDRQFKKRIIFPEHHESHAASAFFPSPFEESAILTIDGVGEWATTTTGTGTGNRIELTNQISFPDSIGLLYSAFTYFCGFHVNGGEGKLMGLAPYGNPVYADFILKEMVDLKDDGSFRLDQSFFDYVAGDRMTSEKFANSFGGPARKPESNITERERDLAASIQSVTETILLKIASHLHKQTGRKNLCVAGGVGLNCVANGRLLRESEFENVWVQPAAGDCGGAVGAALFVWHQLLDNARTIEPDWSANLGAAVSSDATNETLDNLGASYQWLSQTELLTKAVDQLDDQRIVGWFQGPMEFGPRALGNRSILADPRNDDMQDTLNRNVKFRESFRPFAPAVMREDAKEYFVLEGESPYMLLSAQVPDQNENPIPAVTHVDGSARVQTVSQTDNEAFYKLLNTFKQKTGCSVLLNTSFNVRGEPIVCSAEDAYRCFMNSGMDALAINNSWMIKSDQPPLKTKTEVQTPVSFWQKLPQFWLTISFPLRYLVSKTVLTLVFFLCVFPIGLIARTIRKKSFQPIDDNAQTYWVDRERSEDKSSYFKQF